jgi:lysophospholipase L1-like esterase
MRDLDRTLEKPDGVVRIAFLGSSVVMGYGVKDDETMTRQLEQMLNARSDGVRYEVLNFGSGRYYAIHRRLLLEDKVLAFNPDLVVYVAHQDELRSAGLVASAVMDGRQLDDDCLLKCVANARIRPDDSDGVISSKLGPETFAILQCTYDRIARTCRDRQLEFAYVYLPIPGEYEYPIDPRIVIDMARDAELTTLDLSDWWQPVPTAKVVVPDTQHPTAEGQLRIAERLERSLAPLIRKTTSKAQSPAS